MIWLESDKERRFRQETYSPTTYSFDRVEEAPAENAQEQKTLAQIFA